LFRAVDNKNHNLNGTVVIYFNLAILWLYSPSSRNKKAPHEFIYSTKASI